MKSLYKTLIWISLFSIAMGYLETSVVVYLRKLIYDGGFWFPIRPIGLGLARTELGRELATVIMLIGIGVLTGRNKLERFAWFIYSFAVWDIFYYVFLKILVDWPASLFTWDLLFLIPVPWVGPVIAPMLVALSFMVLALFIVFAQQKNPDLKIKPVEWTLIIGGCLVVIFSFMIDYLIHSGSIEDTGGLGSPFSSTRLLTASSTYIPSHFHWWIYVIGLGMLWVGIGRVIWRWRKDK